MRSRRRGSSASSSEGQELVQRPVEQADRDRQAGHRLEDPLEVALLDRQQPLERGAAALLVLRQDHLAHQGEPLHVGEHVLGAAEADALRAELARLRGVAGRVRVRAHLEPAQLVGPLEDRPEVLVDLRRHELDRADDHVAARAVDRDHVALVQLVLADLRRPSRPGRARACRTPTTHGIPSPRATTAACEVSPPCAVRIPAASRMPA